MSPEHLALMMIIGLIVGILLGFPVAFLMSGLALIFGYIALGSRILHLFPNIIFSVMRDYELTAIPTFLFMGAVLATSGIAEQLYASLHRLMGPLKGGLAMATQIISTIFAACMGVVGPSVIAAGRFALPSMLKRGYDKELSTGIIMAGGTLAAIIPPAILLILYADQAGIAVSTLFTAAIIPGLVISGLCLAYIGIRCNLQPNLGPPMPATERQVPAAVIWREAASSLLPTIIVVAAVLSTMSLGIVAPTEAGGIGSIGALLVVAFAKKLNLANLKEAIEQSLRSTVMILFLIVGATLFTAVFLRLGGGEPIQTFILGLASGAQGTLLTIVIMILAIIVLGTIMDCLATVLILTPLYMPIITALGLDMVWFGVLFCVALAMGHLTPPFAYSIFYLKTVAEDVTTSHLYRGSFPFVVIYIVGLVFVYAFPQLSLWLPNLGR
jgi:tripartite ATP-independent transporter DctM subunit